ncbi:Pkinase-domain-containing protein [Hyphopichia burtonii NRRL Y-1933]|uniref:non-specific serine/threonine protein kinase n=1 Tax=Hyphopichia burtonii NRRL Y-1933 TaxID=984485 RepID=A0A1E4RKG6_9ASCO|nr:Pkinase-domain-containing protein [Hyphopichia burtonii NRRL Y-1933]ODV67759.1 Pkinase-domain-containing protein [Hyphopichia burtonii NRRL Y-1933]
MKQSWRPKEEPPTLFAGLVNQVKSNTGQYHGQYLDPLEKQDSRSFVEKYGRCQEVIGRGSFGVVRISHKKIGSINEEVSSITNDEILYAVKEFKRKPQELEKKYSRRLTSEFCISSSLKHVNIIDTLDLLKDAKGDYCEVMEFCSGGDLYTLIIALGKLEYAEADCFFKQLIRGVNYMHDMGVSHRDLKPENLLLTQNGILKITDFGNGECFKMAWEDDIQLSEGICGSSPYIAPEEFSQSSFDPRGVDIWSCGVIYMAMRTGRQLWKLADAKKDEFFQEYLVKRKDATGYEPIESLKRARCRNVIYSILDPKPERRINGKQILNSEWGREIKVCEAGEGKHN